MYSFGTQSQANLKTCSYGLQRVANELIKRVDFSVIEGARSARRQAELFHQNLSELDGVNKLSMHQVSVDEPLARAFDLLPYPGTLHGVNVWKDDTRFALFAGEVLATGWHLGVELIWGGDWNGDGSRVDHSFFDAPHFQEVT